MLKIQSLHAGVEDKEIIHGIDLTVNPGEIHVILGPNGSGKSTLMQELKIDPSYATRYMNVGFSGGEKKRNEILQLLMLQPKLALLDETDSGLDVDAVQIVSNGVAKFHSSDNACIIITHNTQILKHLTVDRVHIFLNGKIVKEGDVELIEEVTNNGYAEFGGV